MSNNFSLSLLLYCTFFIYKLHINNYMVMYRHTYNIYVHITFCLIVLFQTWYLRVCASVIMTGLHLLLLNDLKL